MRHRSEGVKFIVEETKKHKGKVCIRMLLYI